MLDCKWPTLEGRLKNYLTSELEALEQLEKSIPLSPYGKRRLENLRRKSKKQLTTFKKCDRV